jgi:proline iminopeptidase
VSERLVAVDGARLALRSTGPAHAPAVVLAHGGPGLCDNLASVATMIDDAARVHRYDQRGCGRSSGGPQQSVAGAVADLDAVRDALGADRWVVGGHSWGAELAVAYALEHPDRVRALLLVAPGGLDPTVPARTRAARLARLGPVGRARVEQMEDRAAGGDPEAAAALARLWWRADLVDPWGPGVDFEAAPLYSCPQRPLVAEALHRSRIRWLADPALASRLAGLVAPALLVRGACDPVPDDAVRDLAAALPAATLVRIPDAGHSPWLEQPAALRTALRDFLAGLPG